MSHWAESLAGDGCSQAKASQQRAAMQGRNQSQEAEKISVGVIKYHPGER